MRAASIAGCPDHPLFINVQPDELLEHFLVQPDDPIFNHSSAVYVELTEAVPLQRLDLCAHMLQEIQARGVHVVVDDLGSGYSNLRYLADLKPRVVKLDRELITGLRAGSRRFTLVRALVTLCNDLEAMVVAECIETPEELAAVIDAGCHLGQGYVLAFARGTCARQPAGVDIVGMDPLPVALDEVLPEPLYDCALLCRACRGALLYQRQERPRFPRHFCWCRRCGRRYSFGEPHWSPSDSRSGGSNDPRSAPI
ncbi:MAG: EAL domain-containing protein [Deltaproteobacteria bacterium]|nr:MAG: EAL domain-containing protein [Deltaproteobacteria bacterium]